MIKARGIVDGRAVVLLGLSGENMTRLMAKEPIVFDGRIINIDAQIVIVGGRTEATIMADLSANGLGALIDGATGEATA